MDTALIPEHQALTAKLVDFSGWNMPLHYGSQVEEHLHVRQHAGVFDVSHMGVVDFKGEHAAAFLRRVCANDVNKISDQQAMYTCLLNQNGGVIDDLLVYRLSPTDYRLVINAGCRQKDIAWLKQQTSEFTKLTMTPQPDLCIIAIQGPHARERCAPFLSKEILNLKPFHFLQQSSLFIARTGYTGEDGVEVILPSNNARQLWQQCINAGIRPCGLGARDTLRLEAGLNLYGHEMDEQTSPAAANLNWTVCCQDPRRDFIGKTAYLEARASNNQRLVGVVMLARGVLRDHQAVLSEQSPVGVITSGGFSPTLGHAIGFARLSSSAMDQPLYIDRRGKQLPLQRIKLPFVKNGIKTF